MKMTKKTILICLVIVLFSGIAAALNAEDFLPFAIGNNWTFQDSSFEGFDTTFSEITDTIFLMGYTTYIMVDDWGDSLKDTMYMQQREDAYYVIDISEEDTMVMKFLQNTFDNGDTWEMLSIEMTRVDTVGEDIYTTIQNIYMNCEIQALIAVTVPAGTFDECIKMVLSGEWSYTQMLFDSVVNADSGIIDTSFNYFGRNIGPVMFDESMEEYEDERAVSVLLEYDLAGIDDNTKTMPDNISLDVYPNPFNSAVSITAPQNARIEIFDLRGNVVCTRNVGARHSRETTTFNEQPSGNASSLQDGARTFIWQPDQTIASGIYLVKARTEDGWTVTRRIVYLR